MRVSSKNEIRFAIGYVTKCAGIVQKHESLVSGSARIFAKNTFGADGTIAEMKIDTEDLDGSGGCLYDPLVVDEQRRADIL